MNGFDRVDFPGDVRLPPRGFGVRIADSDSAFQEHLGRSRAVGVVIGTQPKTSENSR